MISTTEKIVAIFESFRMSTGLNDQYDTIGKSKLIERINNFVLKNEIIKFVMLGFPFKSVNTSDKVLGRKPDLGELLTIMNFTAFNSEVQKVYAPGVQISIASDGYIFNNLLGVSDYDVEQYLDISSDMARHSPIRWYTLNNFYSHDTNTNREKLYSQFGISELELENRILTDDDTNYLYKSMTRFMHEELAMQNFASGNQLHKAAKKLSREMMLANEAYSALIRHEFEGRDYVRISMHPSVNNGTKYSFQLIRGKNIRHSAWHSAIVETNEGHVTMHKKDALAAGYELVYENKQPFYFQQQ